ncbi:hypothetical protein FF1_036896 [Malus domestica]
MKLEEEEDHHPSKVRLFGVGLGSCLNDPRGGHEPSTDLTREKKYKKGRDMHLTPFEKGNTKEGGHRPYPSWKRKGGWRPEFVVRRGLKENDEIGLYLDWDWKTSKYIFRFSILQRAR